MSTKLFHGYKIQSMSLKELDRWTNDLRERIQRTEQQLRANLMGSLAVDVIDQVALAENLDGLRSRILNMSGNKETNFNESPILLALLEVMNREKEIEKTNHRDPKFYFDCTVQILPIKRTLLALLFTEQDAYRRVWRRMPGVREYAYWNNIDRPEGLSRAAWERRSRNWDEAMGPSGVPAHRGFTITCHGNLGFQMPEAVSQAVSSWRRRVLRQTRRVVLDQWMKKHHVTPDNFFSLARRQRDWLDTPEGRLATVHARHDIALRLPKVIAQDMISTSINDLFTSFKSDHDQANLA